VTFQEIYTAVLQARFASNQTTDIKRWVNFREAQVWAAADWPWKSVGPTNLTVTSGDNTPAIPADCFVPLAVYDDQGYRLRYSIQTDFDDAFLMDIANNNMGRPTDFKWNDGVMTLGPTPSANYTYKFSYQRKLAHYATSGALTTGPMAIDTDYPIFDSTWHQILVMGAMSTGLKIENDPTWEPLESEFSHMVGNMIDYYLPSVAVAGNMQYGADWEI
jgi:hypothetical protein